MVVKDINRRWPLYLIVAGRCHCEQMSVVISLLDDEDNDLGD
uniref:Uncharacterized protein n=1 Tax=Nelumbo nucifera TaxID=4432 RepID=A0A822XXS4_NELNU|nr:TPA_asm: hypothetical protein HUJ06_025269 [Nelumbo nucifera]